MAATQSYLDLLTSEHRDKPKFAATVSATVDPLAALQAALYSMPGLYDLDGAAGDQLDGVGAWAGVPRNVSVPLTGVYFAWRDATVGWRAGVWKGRLDPASGLVSLPDDSYRLLIRAKIAANRWDGTVPGAYAVWSDVFPAASVIVIQDNQDMSMTVGMAGQPLSVLDQALLVGGYIPLKPEGVRVNYVVVPVAGPLFGWRAATAGIAGWRAGSWARRI